MWRSMTVATVLAAAFLINAAPAHAQRWGRGATPRSGVCFYEDINYGGRYFCDDAGASMARVSSGNNDEISSIRLFGNAVATVYRDPNFNGSSRVIESSVSDLRGMGFNDRISSYEVGAARYNAQRAVPRSSNSNNVPYGPAVQSRQSSRWNYRDAEQTVRQSYRAVLGREPEPAGLRSWTQETINNNWTQRDLEWALRQSDEYRQLHSTGRRR
jgi:hypothetical protein